MRRPLFSGVVGAVIAAGASLAGAWLLPSEVHLDARSDWRSFSTGLRRSGIGDALAGTGRVTLRLAGVREQDSVALLVSTRPGVEPITIAASRGGGVPVSFSVGSLPFAIRMGAGRGARFSVEVNGSNDPDRALYRLHAITVTRAGWFGSSRPFLPILAGLILFAIGRRYRGDSRLAMAWSLCAITLSLAILFDPLDFAATSVRSSWVWLLAALGVALVVVVEPQFGVLQKACLLGGLAFLVGVLSHIPGLNGSPYHNWAWQDFDGLSGFGLVLLASVPLFTARLLWHTRAARPGPVIALLAAGAGLTAYLALRFQYMGVDRMHAVIEHAVITSYYSDAMSVAPQAGWLASFPKLLEDGLQGHSLTKPPGPVLFFVSLIHILGVSSVTAASGALAMVLGATMAIPGVYLLAREFGESAEAAFEAACAIAVAPSLLLFCPGFDQAFPAMTCALLISWHRAVTGRSARAAVCCGLLGFVASFFSYSFFVLGVAGLVVAVRDPRQGARGAATAGITVAVCYGLLHATTGFNPVATFLAAYKNQSYLSIGLARDYGWAALTDPLDFAMGVGWLTSALAIATACRVWLKHEWDPLTVLFIVQVAAVDLAGVLRVETARVWLLLAPLVVVPAGRELAGWNVWARTGACLTMVLLLAAIAQSMRFL